MTAGTGDTRQHVRNPTLLGTVQPASLRNGQPTEWVDGEGTEESETDLQDVRKSATWSSGWQKAPGGPRRGRTVWGGAAGSPAGQSLGQEGRARGDSIFPRPGRPPGPG